jgi:hypothetical protein
MFALCTERDRREESGADGENPYRIKATKVQEKVSLDPPQGRLVPPGPHGPIPHAALPGELPAILVPSKPQCLLSKWRSG